ncbi:MAG TPA: ATP-binding protein [Pirellulales bacterium]|nr:ATP-binding protein [Pirellulales bacterium]
MSYRSFKRHLGETHLERKLLVLFGVCLFALISASFWFYGSQTDSLVAKQNPAQGRLLVETILITTHWEKLDFIGAQKRTSDWSDLYTSLTAKLNNLDYEWRFIRPGGPVKSKQPADDFEADVFERFLRGSPIEPAQGGDSPDMPNRFAPDGKRYEYYQPVYATHAECVNCHRIMTDQKDLAKDGLIAVAKVSISNEATLADQNRNRAILITLAIGATFLAVIAAYLIIRYVIVKPLNHLREVSDAVGHGNLEQRAEIHTADEFEDLAVAFNRMLGNLVAAQDQLRKLNGNLDLKVDELAQANMQLFELNRLKSDFLATMSHELRTPLNSIIGFSDVLGSIKSLDDKQRRYVQNIQKSGKMLLDMINDILDLAKIESGKMEVRPSEFRIEHVIGAQCDMARPLTERKNIDLEIEVEQSLPELYQDQGKVQQILNNLLSNAIKFTPEGGRIVVSARRGGADELLLTVGDTGVGIAEEDQGWIFEKFRQGQTVMPAGDAMTREYSGTGLGLSIVKELCKLLGGDISLASELGKGSVFTASLPYTIAELAGHDSSLSALTMPRRDEFDSASPRPVSAASPAGQ